MAKRNWYSMKSTGRRTAQVLVYGEIGQSFWGEETVDAKQFSDDLAALGQLDEIDLRVNSPGGDVFAGIAIHNTLKKHKAKVVATVDGIAASAASYITMAADKIVMPKNAFMLVHGASGFAWGNAADMRKTAEDLERINTSLTATYAARSKKDDATIAALMLEDRLMDASEALEYGLADEVTEEVQMAANYPLKLLPKAVAEKIAAVIPKEEAKAPPPEASSQGQGEEPETPPAPVPADPPEAKAGDNVVQLDAARNEGEAKFAAYVNEVNDLCALAGLPQKAAAFIKAKTAIETVRSELITARAGAGDQINPANPGNPSLSAPASTAWAKIAASLNK